MDRNERVLAGEGTGSSIGIVPGKLENREEAITQVAENTVPYIDYQYGRRGKRKRRKRICC